MLALASGCESWAGWINWICLAELTQCKSRNFLHKCTYQCKHNNGFDIFWMWKENLCSQGTYYTQIQNFLPLPGVIYSRIAVTINQFPIDEIVLECSVREAVLFAEVAVYPCMMLGESWDQQLGVWTGLWGCNEAQPVWKFPAFDKRIHEEQKLEASQSEQQTWSSCQNWMCEDLFMLSPLYCMLQMTVKQVVHNWMQEASSCALNCYMDARTRTLLVCIHNFAHSPLLSVTTAHCDAILFCSSAALQAWTWLSQRVSADLPSINTASVTT